MTLTLFYILSVVALVGAAGVVTTRNVVYAALALLLSLMAVAGLYVLLFAEFLALVQVLIYGGAIIIVLLFAIMLTRTQEFPVIRDNPQWALGGVAGLAVFGVLAAAFFRDAPRMNVTGRAGVPLADLGHSLFTDWAVPFEVASVVLLVALIGAIVIARAGGRE